MPAYGMFRATATRALASASIRLLATACEWTWMEQTVRFQDGLVLTFQHRSSGTFRTIARNENGSFTTDLNTGQDGRHVSLYRSPSRRIIAADYGETPLVITFDQSGSPLMAGAEILKEEFKIAGQWRYMGSVHRDAENHLVYYPKDSECQIFDDGPPGRVARSTPPCSGLYS